MISDGDRNMLTPHGEALGVPVEIACCFDQAMYVGFCALVGSIAAHQRIDRHIIIHVVVAEGYGPDLETPGKNLPMLEFRLHTVSPDLFQAPSETTLSKEIYYRLLLPSLLETSSKVVYLDCDIIVLKDISPLFDVDLHGSALAAVPDHALDYQTRACGVPWSGFAVHLEAYVARIADTTVEAYFNSGVMVLDLDTWRRDALAERCFERLALWPDTRFADQDTLNAVVEDYVRLDCRWNAFSHFVLTETPKKVDATWAAIADLWVSDPWIVHFAGPKKPWSDRAISRYSQLFWAYAQQSGYRRPNVPLGVKANLSGTPSLPRVSVIIINHNYGRYLEQSVQSVVLQNYPAVECIVVDNASTDHSAEVLGTLARRFADLRIERRATNDGQCIASQAGFALATGDYVVFLDADDYLLPNALKTHIVAHLSAPQARGFTSGDMVQCAGDALVASTYIDSIHRARCRTVKKVDPHALRDIRVIGKTFDDFFGDIDRLGIKLYDVDRATSSWVWAPTSGKMYRSDFVEIFMAGETVKSLFFHLDSYLNLAINSLFGSLIIDAPVAVYRIHGHNAFSLGISGADRVVYARDKDLTCYAAYLALRHISDNFAAFSDSTSIGSLRNAVKTLSKRASDNPLRWRRWVDRLRKVQHALLRARIETIARSYKKNALDPTKR